MRSSLDQWRRDLRHAVRALRRAPGFTAMTVGTLGLAIGVNAGMFSVVNKVLLDPLPYANADRLLFISASAPGSDLQGEFGVANEFFVQYKEQARLLEDLSTFNSFTSTMRAGDRVERIRMSQPTSSLFTTLGARPIRGRLPTADDEDRVAVISHALWMSWFGGDEGVIGRTYDIAGSTPHRRRRHGTGVQVSFRRHAGLDLQSDSSGGHHAWTIRPAARRRAWSPGATPETVAAELNALALPVAGTLRRLGQLRAPDRPASRGRPSARGRAARTRRAAAVGAAGGRRDRAADCLRQCGQPVPRARRGPAARPCGPSRDRRRPRAARSGADVGGRRRRSASPGLLALVLGVLRPAGVRAGGAGRDPAPARRRPCRR